MFGASLFSVFGVMLVLAGISLGQCDTAAVRRAAVLMGVIILLMVGIMVRGRHLTQQGIVKGGSSKASGASPTNREFEHLLKPGVVGSNPRFSRQMVTAPPRGLATAL